MQNFVLQIGSMFAKNLNLKKLAANENRKLALSVEFFVKFFVY